MVSSAREAAEALAASRLAFWLALNRAASSGVRKPCGLQTAQPGRDAPPVLPCLKAPSGQARMRR